MSEPTEIEILFIEDNPHEAELAIRSLKKHSPSCKLKHLDDGEEALDFIFSRGKFAGREPSVIPRLIILDLKIPRVDGLEILRKLKADAVKKLIPVVVLTSSQEEKDIYESYKLGVNSYIVKPVNFESFSKAVAKLGMYWLSLNKIPGYL